jgi:hypothetical protein
MEFITALTILAIFVVAVVGYVMNIVKLVTSKEITGKTLARVVGVFVFPLGAILGFVSN